MQANISQPYLNLEHMGNFQEIDMIIINYLQF